MPKYRLPRQLESRSQNVATTISDSKPHTCEPTGFTTVLRGIDKTRKHHYFTKWDTIESQELALTSLKILLTHCICELGRKAADNPFDHLFCAINIFWPDSLGMSLDQASNSILFCRRGEFSLFCLYLSPVCIYQRLILLGGAPGGLEIYCCR